MRTNKKIGLRLLAALQHRSSVSVRSVVAIIAKGLCIGLLATGFNPHQTVAGDDAVQLLNHSRQLSTHDGVAATSTIETQPVVVHRPKRANFERMGASQQARQVADWVVDSGDNHRMPFVIVDKTDAKVFVFEADGWLRGAAPALLGLAIGDYAIPGIGSRKLSSIRPEERTTPAGRFVAALGRNLHGKEILWVDYEGAVSIHPVVTNNPKEHRAQRLATPTPLDNRISYGCINVPAKFYENIVRPTFTGTNGIVYVLPEIMSTSEVFASYVVEEHARIQTASQPVFPQVASGCFNGKDLTTVPAILKVAANPQSTLFGASNPALPSSFTGLLNKPVSGTADTAGTVLSDALTNAAGETVKNRPYAITQDSLATNSNYTFGFTHNDLTIMGTSAEPILGFNAGQIIFAGLINNRFYYRPGNFGHISLNPNNVDPGLDMVSRTNDLNSRLSQTLNSCDSFSGGGFCETWSFLQKLEKVNAK